MLKYQKRIYDLAYSFTHNVEDAYDLSQDIFLKAFTAIHIFRANSAFYTWLYQIARNTGIDYTRRRKRRNLIIFADMTLINRLSKEKLQNQPIHQIERDELIPALHNTFFLCRGNRTSSNFAGFFRKVKIKSLVLFKEFSIPVRQSFI